MSWRGSTEQFHHAAWNHAGQGRVQRRYPAARGAARAAA
jgi:hypothetical protein